MVACCISTFYQQVTLCCILHTAQHSSICYCYELSCFCYIMNQTSLSFLVPYGSSCSIACCIPYILDKTPYHEAFFAHEATLFPAQLLQAESKLDPSLRSLLLLRHAHVQFCTSCCSCTLLAPVEQHNIAGCWLCSSVLTPLLHIGLTHGTLRSASCPQT